MSSLDGVGRNGELRLTFAQRAGRTVMTENYSRPPLQVMKAITDGAGCLNVYLLSPTGGVVQGDRYAIRIDVGANAHALFTTQAATKVYRMPNGCAEQTIRIEVQAGAVFEFVPDAAILFADADLSQQIEVTLHEGALLFLHEIVLPGRIARGERLQFRRYRNRVTVRDGEGLLLHDAATIQPSLPYGGQDMDASGVLEGYTAWGSAYLLGDLAGRGIDAEAFCASHQDLFKMDEGIGALSPLYRNGVGARVIARRLETVYAAFHGLREVVRTRYLGLPAAPLRK